ncbi:MAG: hypothetical protein WCO84_03410 [bacterium]
MSKFNEDFGVPFHKQTTSDKMNKMAKLDERDIVDNSEYLEKIKKTQQEVDKLIAEKKLKEEREAQDKLKSEILNIFDKSGEGVRGANILNRDGTLKERVQDELRQINAITKPQDSSGGIFNEDGKLKEEVGGKLGDREKRSEEDLIQLINEESFDSAEEKYGNYDVSEKVIEVLKNKLSEIVKEEGFSGVVNDQGRFAKLTEIVEGKFKTKLGLSKSYIQETLIVFLENSRERDLNYLKRQTDKLALKYDLDKEQISEVVQNLLAKRIANSYEAHALDDYGITTKQAKEAEKNFDLSKKEVESIDKKAFENIFYENNLKYLDWEKLGKFKKEYNIGDEFVDKLLKEHLGEVIKKYSGYFFSPANLANFTKGLKSITNDPVLIDNAVEEIKLNIFIHKIDIGYPYVLEDGDLEGLPENLKFIPEVQDKIKNYVQNITFDKFTPAVENLIMLNEEEIVPIIDKRIDEVFLKIKEEKDEFRAHKFKSFFRIINHYGKEKALSFAQRLTLGANFSSAREFIQNVSAEGELSEWTESFKNNTDVQSALLSKVEEVMGASWSEEFILKWGDFMSAESLKESFGHLANKNISASILFCHKLLAVNNFGEILRMIKLDEDESKNEAKQKTIINLIIAVNPVLKELFTNPTKLGKATNLITNKIVQFIGKIEDRDDLAMILSGKMLEISRVFQSSDSSVIDKRSLFLELYDPDIDSKDKQFLGEIQSLSIDNGISKTEAYKKIVLKDEEGLLIESGSHSMMVYFEKLLSREQDENKKADLESKINRIRGNIKKADKRNRQLFTKINDKNISQEEKVELIVPKETSVSQVGPEKVTLPILEEAAFCDALLGELGAKQENNLGLHISATKYYDKIGMTLLSRLPSYDNLHGALVNRVYGDISGYPHKYYGPSGSEDDAFSMGPAHKCIILGLPSTMISSIVVKDEVDVFEQKKAVAMNGFYIPIVRESDTEILFTPDEFDEMKVFYGSLHRQGYPSEVIDSVYKYYLEQKNSGEVTKHKIVIEKGFDFVREQLNSGLEQEKTFDLAVLVDFLKKNDLNKKDIGWYQTSSFGEVMEQIRGDTASKNRWKARDALFIYPEGFDKKPKSISENIETIKSIERKPHGFIDAFEGQLEYITPPQTLYFENLEYQKNIRNLMFREGINTDEINKPSIRIGNIENSAKYFTEKRVVLMRFVWNECFNKVGDKISDKKQLSLYRELLIPIITGSLGRSETVLGSDLDYNILLDDEKIPADIDKDKFMQEIKEFVNNVLSPEMGELIKEKKLRPDAGLGKEDRKPFSIVSRIKEFDIELSKKRQEEEPTEIITMEPLFTNGEEIVKKAKNYLFENKSAYLLSSFVERDLQIGTKEKNSFIADFEELYSSVASGNIIKKIKESMQRTLVFKMNQLLFQAIEDGKIAKAEVDSIPSAVVELIRYLGSRGILSEKETTTCEGLWAVSYKLRFLGEVYSDGGANTEKVVKVKNVEYKIEDLSYDDRTVVFQLLKDFREQVLYK